MLEQLNDELLEIREKMRQRSRLKTLWAAAEDNLVAEQQRLRELKKRLDKEHGDVKKLEGLSLTSLFYSVLGGKDEKMKKERQEFLAAKLRHDECEESVTALQEEVEDLVGRAKAFADLDARHHSLLGAKEQFITDAGGDRAARLLSLSEELAERQSDLREIDEALYAGKTARQALADVIESLQSAKNWGVGDLLVGGIITTAIKHSKIDAARSKAHEAQRYLRRFARELSDVEPDADTSIAIEIGSFMTFADYFFDGLIVDWMVQSKIQKSYDEVRKVKDSLRGCIGRLEHARSEMGQQVHALQEDRRQALETM